MKIRIFSIVLALLIVSVMAQDGDGEQKECFRFSSDECVCIRKCGQDAVCKEKCIKWRKDLGKIISIIGVIFATIAEILAFATIIVMIVTELQRRQIWYYHPYRKLKREYNKVGNQTMLREEFVRKRDLVIHSLRKSSKQNNFYFLQDKWRKITHVSQVKIINEKKPLMTQIELKGKGRRKWTARGYIMSKNNQIFMWFMKQYEKGSSDSRKQIIVYTSTEFVGGDTLMSGKYREKFSSQWSRTWKLEKPRLMDQIAMSEQIIEV